MRGAIVRFDDDNNDDDDDDDTVKAKQSTAEYGRRLCFFCPSNKLTFDLLILKVVSKSHVTWATSVPILDFLDLSVLDLGSMHATDRRQTSYAHHRLMPPPDGGGGITSCAGAATICPRPMQVDL